MNWNSKVKGKSNKFELCVIMTEMAVTLVSSNEGDAYCIYSRISQLFWVVKMKFPDAP